MLVVENVFSMLFLDSKDTENGWHCTQFQESWR